jgi:hypothetical protein
VTKHALTAVDPFDLVYGRRRAPSARERDWLPPLVAFLAVFLVFATLTWIGVAGESIGTVAFRGALGPRWSVPHGNHLVVAAVRAQNTGTVAINGWCTVEAYAQRNYYLGTTDFGVVQPGRSVTLTVPVPIPGPQLATDVTYLWVFCSPDQW